MRTVQVVVIAEGVDQLAGVVEVEELVFVEALVAELAVEAFDIAVLRRLAWRDEAVMDGVAPNAPAPGPRTRVRCR